MRIAPSTLLASRQLQMMNFLNEVPMRYPSAISFAPGRPAEAHFHVRDSLHSLSNYVLQSTEVNGVEPDGGFDSLGQYQRTNGIINDAICAFLQNDEGIQVGARDVMITNGCQEAMAIILIGLFNATTDVLLAPDPTYVGMTGMAQLLGIEVQTIPVCKGWIEPSKLAQHIQEIRARGKQPRAVYVIPDFDNPLGTSMPLDVRHELLNVAAEEQILICEDNPYGMFAYDNDSMPTLKALDRHDIVLYLGTFSKILYPALRIGFLVADQVMQPTEGAKLITLAEELSKVKGLVSVNTSPLLQATVGSLLMESNYSLRDIVRPKIAAYKRKRDIMLECLTENFGTGSALARIVRWNRPCGGFFLNLVCPFALTEQDVQVCAEQYGVIFCPVSFFSINGVRTNEVRLAFSYVSEKEIEVGVHRFARFLHDRMRNDL